MGMSAEDVADWLAASCAEQGVPVLVTDPRILADVAVLLSAGRSSDPPDRSNAARVEGSAALLSGVDDGVVEDR